MLMCLCRIEKSPVTEKNGRTESDDLKTGTIPKHGLDVKMIEVVLDGCLTKKVL